MRIFAIAYILMGLLMNQTEFFKALSDPTRLAIVKMIIGHENVCVCELTEKLQLSQPKISRHLALLRNLSILIDARKGQWVYYSLHPQLPTWATEILNVLVNDSIDLTE